MKKTICALTLVLTLGIGFNSVKAADKPNNEKTEMTSQQQAEFDRIVNRVEEIKNMDKSSLSRADKKELRNELKTMKKEAKAMSGGVYLSVGAIIIIILLLILIL